MKHTIFFLVLVSQIFYSQNINVKDYGAEGNGKSDDTEYFLKAIHDINQKYSTKKHHVVLYVPSGTYTISRPIVLNKYISILGEFINNTILRAKTTSNELIILEKNINEGDIYNGYNYVKNISLQGPDFENSANPFINKLVDADVKNSIGIRINGLRTRIEDTQIEGFLNSGIEIRGSYYTFIKNSFIINNGVGVLIDDKSTSAFLTSNEIRHNSIAIIVTGYSFANFINGNMIESNVTNFKPYDKSPNYENIFSGGRGIIIRNSSSNQVSNNYFENHSVNITIDSGAKNVITNNFININENNTAGPNKKQIDFQLVGVSAYNIFENNSTFPTNRMIIGEYDYSTNRINVGNENTKLKSELQKTIKNAGKLPQINN